MTRNPIARHLRQHRHQVVTDKRVRDSEAAAAREVSELMAKTVEAMADILWNDGEGRFNPTKSDGTNYD